MKVKPWTGPCSVVYLQIRALRCHAGCQAQFMEDSQTQSFLEMEVLTATVALRVIDPVLSMTAAVISPSLKCRLLMQARTAASWVGI